MPFEAARIDSDPPQYEKMQRDFISYKTLRGTKAQAEHPTLGDDSERSSAERYRSDDEVECLLAGHVERIKFDDYLEMIGSNYADYFRTMKTTKAPYSQREILTNIHQKSIDDRTAVGERADKKYTTESATKHNLQQETAKDHSLFFSKVINDLGIDGLSVEQAPPREDYLDAIDEYLVLDPAALRSYGEEQGKKIYIGIQRSFNDKRREKLVRMMPENPEKGPVFRVYLKENLEEYIDNPGDGEAGVSFWQKMLDIRTSRARKAGMAPRDYAKGKFNGGLPTVDKVLPGGQRAQLDKARKVMLALKIQLDSFLQSQELASHSERVQRILKRNSEEIRTQDFLKAIEELRIDT